MTNQVVRNIAALNMENVAPIGLVDDDIHWMSFHDAATGSGTALAKIDITDVDDLVLGNTVTIPARMAALTYPNESSVNETEKLGQRLLDWLNTNGWFVKLHNGDPGSEAQNFDENGLTGLGTGRVTGANAEVADA